MALKREYFEALKDIVGPENISEEALILDSYAAFDAVRPPLFSPRFEAVLLPGNVTEVQNIVKFCNRNKIQYKASSTGWGRSSAAAKPGVILLDLVRMNHILKINEKNMYAVIEPHVTASQLQNELMKIGLNHCVNGAGSQASALPLTLATGHSTTSLSTSNEERNILGVEWVTPEGEIVRLGSLGSSGKWFCGDGPGPSLRGLLRGSCFTAGGMGVFTAAAKKLYHWPGPSTFPIVGASPNYAPTEIPYNFMIRFFSFPTTEKMVEAQRKISESEIAFMVTHSLNLICGSIAKSNPEFIEILGKYRKLVGSQGFIVAIAGNSLPDFNYKKEVLEKIIEETNGESLKPIEDPQIGGALLWRFIRVTQPTRESVRSSGGVSAFQGGHSYYDLVGPFAKKALECKSKLIKNNLIFDDGLDLMPWPAENGHFGMIEVIMRFVPNPETLAGLANMHEEVNNVILKGFSGCNANLCGDALHNKWGPHISNYHIWLRKIKQAFDPRGVSDPTRYITAEEAKQVR